MAGQHDQIIVEENALYKHKPWFPHPESPRRINILLEAIAENNLSGRVLMKKIDYDEKDVLSLIRRFHYKGYIDYLFRLRSKTPCEIDPDTYYTSNTLELALESIYLSYITAFDTSSPMIKVLIIRPPGHHAGKGGKAMNAPTQGFCILNNAAAAVHGFRDNGLGRIVVIDFDVHHGNGTQEIFYSDPSVLHIDIHRDPRGFYPFTGYPSDFGEGKGRGYSLNFIVCGGTGDDSYIEVFGKALNLVGEYGGEALVISAGFDGYIGDGLSDLRLTEYTYYNIGLMIRSLKLPTVIVLEGGYESGLRRGFPYFIKGLFGYEGGADLKPTRTDHYVKALNNKYVDEIYSLVKKMWR